MSRLITLLLLYKSVEAAIKKLMDEGYIIKYGLGKNTFYAKTF